MALPSQAIMDNHFYYGENIIIGNRELTISDYDEPMISYSQSIRRDEPKRFYLQYGLIYKETKNSKFDKSLYCNEGIGFNLHLQNLRQCITQKSNMPFWDSQYYGVKNDLRNPINFEVKREIFKHFGLDADKSYEENLTLKRNTRIRLF